MKKVHCRGLNVSSYWNLPVRAVLLFLCLNLVYHARAIAQINVSHLNNDSIVAIEIVKRSNIDTSRTIQLNRSGLQLDLTKVQAKKITKLTLYPIYGRMSIRRQRPFHFVKVNSYWVIWGNFNFRGRKYGGVFEIIINSRDAKVEYLSHGK